MSERDEYSLERSRALRLVLANVRRDRVAAAAVVSEASASEGGVLALALATGRVAATVLLASLGAERAEDALLRDVDANLGGGDVTGSSEESEDDEVAVVVGRDRFGEPLWRWVPASVASEWDDRRWGRLQ